MPTSIWSETEYTDDDPKGFATGNWQQTYTVHTVMRTIYSRRTTYHSWLIYLDAFSKLMRTKIVAERENAARWVDHL